MLKPISRLFSPPVFLSTTRNIVDVLVKPDEVSPDIVKALQEYLLKDEVITNFF